MEEEDFFSGLEDENVVFDSDQENVGYSEESVTDSAESLEELIKNANQKVDEILKKPAIPYSDKEELLDMLRAIVKNSPTSESQNLLINIYHKLFVRQIYYKDVEEFEALIYSAIN